MTLGPRFGAVVVVGVLVAWGLSFVVPYDIVADVDPTRAGLGSTGTHWLGTDHMGRDVAMRLLLAPRAFVGPGFLACVIAVLLGTGSGAIAGYMGGTPSAVLRFASTLVAAIPRFVLVLLAIAIYGNSTTLLGIVVGIAYAPSLAEAVFTRVDSLRRAEFVLAALAHGISRSRILLYHLLWVNCRRLVARHMLFLFGYLLLLETTLSYIGGFGVAEPQPSWGNMLAFEFGQREGNALAIWAPAVAIWLTIFGGNLLADALGERRNA